MPSTKQKAVAKRAAGKFASTFDLDVALRICERVAEGETLSAVCAEDGMPDRKTFRMWVVRDEALRRAYDAARQIKAASLFDEALDIARQLKKGEFDNASVNAKRVAIETLKWAAAKLDPREYGERSTALPPIAIQINTPLWLGNADRESGPAVGENLYTIQATVPMDELGGSTGTDPAEPRPNVPTLADGRALKRRSE